MDQQEVAERFAVEELCGADTEKFTEAFSEFIQESGAVEPSAFFGPISTPELFSIALTPRPSIPHETVVAAVQEISRRYLTANELAIQAAVSAATPYEAPERRGEYDSQTVRFVGVA